MQYYLKYYFWLFLNTGAWVCSIFNIILFTAGLTGTLAEGSAFNRGNFVNNVPLCIILIVVNILFLQILLLDLKGSKNLNSNLFIIGVTSIFFCIFFIGGEYPIKNEDKIPTLYIFIGTGIFISIATIHKILEYLMDKGVFNSIKNKLTTLLKRT